MTCWQSILQQEEQQEYFVGIKQHIAQGRAEGKEIFPADEDIFNSFTMTPFEQVKVVILGQDPYHGPGQAHGLSFSVQKGIKIPPSLRNMYKELEQDIPAFTTPEHGCLEAWAQRGVLLLNTVLTVEKGQAHSHAKIGWEHFTDRIIATLNEQRQGVVFLLWGSHGQKKGRFMDQAQHHVLQGPHPSPLSAYRGFFGCGHFSKANALLEQQGQTPINWQV